MYEDIGETFFFSCLRGKKRNRNETVRKEIWERQQGERKRGRKRTSKDVQVQNPYEHDGVR